MKVKPLLAIFLAVVLVAGFSVYLIENHTTEKSISVGPKLSVINSDSIGGINGTETIQVFSVMPSVYGPFNGSHATSYNISAYNSSSNPVFVELANASIPYSNNVTTLFLSSVFTNITKEWVNLFSGFKGSQEVSLQLEATLSVVKNGTVYVYNYYNNIPFDPYKVTYSTYSGNSKWFSNTSINPADYSSIDFVNLSFSIRPSFNISNPDFVQKLNSTPPSAVSNMPLSIIGPGPCKTGTYYVPTHWNNTTGPFPLVAAEISLNDSTATSSLTDSAAFANASVSLNLTSNQVSVSTSNQVTSQMSTNPAYDKNGYIYVASSPPAYPSSTTINGKTTGPNATIAMIAINNATIQTVHGNIIYEYTSGSYCVGDKLGNYTNMQISFINTKSGFQMEGYYLPIEASTIMGKVFNNNVSLGTLSPSKEILGSTVWTHSQGYTNANSVYQQVSGQLKTFSESLGIGLALADLLALANGADADASEGAVVADTLKLVATTTEMASTLISEFAGISFVSQTSISGFGYGITDNPFPGFSGSTYSIFDHESTDPVTFDANGNTYSFNAPSNYVTAY